MTILPIEKLRYDKFSSDRMGHHLATAFVERFADQALEEARLVKLRLDRTVTALEENGND